MNGHRCGILGCGKRIAAPKVRIYRLADIDPLPCCPVCWKGMGFPENLWDSKDVPLLKSDGPTVGEFQTYVLNWSAKTFGHSLALPKVHHLRKEVEELLANPSDPSEIADCFILLAGLAEIAGVDLLKVGLEKMKINEGRTWGAPDDNGVCEHISEGKEGA